MTGGDLLDEAVAELYSADPEGFMARRQELAVHAREAGQAQVAKQITALRKPTRTAWVINQFARSDPDAITRLTELGAELRAVERAGDGSRLRELSQSRRQLVATLVRRALENSGQDMAPAGMREEITATFAAALADAEVAEQIQQGTLVRAQRRSGFGTAQAPTLTVVLPLPDSHRTAKAKPKPKPKPRSTPEPETTATATSQAPAEAPAATTKARQPAGRAAEQQAKNKAEQQAEKKAEQQAAQQQRLARARAKAEQALADADHAVAAAAQDQRDQEKAIRRLERELAAARSHLRAAAAESRRAEAVQRRARQALDRLPKQ